MVDNQNSGSVAVPLRKSRLRGILSNQALQFILKDPQTRMGIAGVAILGTVIAFAVIQGGDPLSMSHTEALNPPSSVALFGTDQLGRDLLSRVVTGLQSSITLSLAALAIACVFGIPWGLFAGYGSGWLDRILMRLADAVLAFPTIILGIATAVVLGPGILNAIVAIAVATVPQLARLLRAEALREKSQEYVLAARSIGARQVRILFGHIFPNTLSATLVFVAVALPRAILLEAALGFLGLSQQPPAPSLGSLVAESRPFLALAPWYAIFPGATIVLLVASFTLLGTGVADALDPSRRKGFSRAFR